MTTVVNNPAPVSDNGGSGFLVGIFVLIILGLVFFYFGLPVIKKMGRPSAPQINIPSQIDVNINPAK